MQTDQARWTETDGWVPRPLGTLGEAAQLVLLFGSTSLLKEQEHLDDITTAYPNAHLFGCSTAGEICGIQVFDDSLVATAVRFEHTQLKGARVKINDVGGSFEAGERLAQALAEEGLAHVFVLSDGLNVNGSELAAGLMRYLPPHVTVTGGLSGDGARFQETLVFWDGSPERNVIAALGLYSTRLTLGYGALGAGILSGRSA